MPSLIPVANVSPENWAAADEGHVKKLERELYDAEVKIDASLPEDQLASFRFYLDDTDSDESNSSEFESDSGSDVFWSDTEV